MLRRQNYSPAQLLSPNTMHITQDRLHALVASIASLCVTCFSMALAAIQCAFITSVLTFAIYCCRALHCDGESMCAVLQS